MAWTRILSGNGIMDVGRSRHACRTEGERAAGRACSITGRRWRELPILNKADSVEAGPGRERSPVGKRLAHARTLASSGAVEADEINTVSSCLGGHFCSRFYCSVAATLLAGTSSRVRPRFFPARRSAQERRREVACAIRTVRSRTNATSSSATTTPNATATRIPRTVIAFCCTIHAGL
jgi:hypothetical protein